MAHEDTLLNVGITNTNSILSSFKEHPNIGEFLHAQTTIGIHSTSVPDPSSFLNFSFDIDGIVMEFGYLQGLQGGVHYLLLPRLYRHNMRPHYHFIKKHLDLKKYSTDGLTALRHAVGHTVAYVDGGYHLLMTVLPADEKDPDTRLLRKELYTTMAVELLNEVVDNFHELLRNLPAKEKARPTIRKQSSFDTSRFHVLMRDAPFVMSLIDQAVEKANSCSFLQVVVFLNQFGQKDIDTLDITDIVDPSQVRSVSVHVACNIVAKDPQTHILFSRYGLQDLVGVKGALFTTLGLHEATNFQSNLDTSGMDVSQELLDVLEKYGKLTFLQLYVDSPHAHIQMPFKHPVSGAIVTSGLSHPNFQKSLLQRAGNYIRHMRDLHSKMVGTLACRIEQVVRFEDRVLWNIDPAEHFNLERLTHLLETHEILVPFKDCGNSGVLTLLQDVLLFLVEGLTQVEGKVYKKASVAQ